LSTDGSICPFQFEDLENWLQSHVLQVKRKNKDKYRKIVDTRVSQKTSPKPKKNICFDCGDEACDYCLDCGEPFCEECLNDSEICPSCEEFLMKPKTSAEKFVNKKKKEPVMKTKTTKQKPKKQKASFCGIDSFSDSYDEEERAKKKPKTKQKHMKGQQKKKQKACDIDVLDSSGDEHGSCKMPVLQRRNTTSAINATTGSNERRNSVQGKLDLNSRSIVLSTD